MKMINGILIPDEVDMGEGSSQPNISQTIIAPPLPGWTDRAGNLHPTGNDESKLWSSFRKPFGQIILNYVNQGCTEDVIKSTFFSMYSANPNLTDKGFWMAFDKIFEANKEQFKESAKKKKEQLEWIEQENAKARGEQVKESSNEVAELKATVNELNLTLKSFLEAFNKK